MRAARRARVFAVLLLAGCGRLDYAAQAPGDASPVIDGGPAIDGSPAIDGDGGPAIDGGAVDARLDAGPCNEATHGGHMYAICGSGLTWSAARALCAARGMHLVRIDDADEHAFLDTLAGDRTRAFFWIGASDLALEDSWSWDDGTVFYLDAETGGMVVGGAFVAWGSAEPNGRTRENCAAMEGNGVWIDLGCELPGDAACESP